MAIAPHLQLANGSEKKKKPTTAYHCSWPLKQIHSLIAAYPLKVTLKVLSTDRLPAIKVTATIKPVTDILSGAIHEQIW